MENTKYLFIHSNPVCLNKDKIDVGNLTAVGVTFIYLCLDTLSIIEKNSINKLNVLLIFNIKLTISLIISTY